MKPESVSPETEARILEAVKKSCSCKFVVQKWIGVQLGHGKETHRVEVKEAGFDHSVIYEVAVSGEKAVVVAMEGRV